MFNEKKINIKTKDCLSNSIAWQKIKIEPIQDITRPIGLIDAIELEFYSP